VGRTKSLTLPALKGSSKFETNSTGQIFFVYLHNSTLGIIDWETENLEK
jgi:hypothetical protein